MTGSRTWALAETTADFDCGKTKTTLWLRQIHKRGADGAHYPLVTSRTDLAAAELVWRFGRRWRRESYFRYSRAHFALDTLDGYTDEPDDLTQPVPNPAKTDTAAAVAAAEHQLADRNRARRSCPGRRPTRQPRQRHCRPRPHPTRCTGS